MKRQKQIKEGTKPPLHHQNKVKSTPSSSLKLIQGGKSARNVDASDEKQLAESGDTPESSDPNFQSELTYDGYQSIEEYDNDVYSSDIEKINSSKSGIAIRDREDDPGMGEEDLLDPQENRK